MRRSDHLIDFVHNENKVSHKPRLSSLPLQILLHYNLLFSLLFAVLMGYVVVKKALSYEYYTAIVVYCIWFIMEPVRAYSGYSGNLMESVPRLSTFLLMTFFPQLPLVTFLAYFQASFFPADRILGSLMFIFLIIECFFGALTIRAIIRSQTSQFMRLVEAD
eukprot:gene10258-11353_t